MQTGVGVPLPRIRPHAGRVARNAAGTVRNRPGGCRLFPATVDDGSIAANAAGGWLHNLGGDAYVVRLACFEEFAAIEGVEVRTIKNRVAKLRQDRLRKWERGVANTFRAELADGRRVEGMLFAGELIWDDDPPPLAGAELR